MRARTKRAEHVRKRKYYRRRQDRKKKKKRKEERIREIFVVPHFSVFPHRSTACYLPLYVLPDRLEGDLGRQGGKFGKERETENGEHEPRKR